MGCWGPSFQTQSVGDILHPTPDKIVYANQNHTKRQTSLENTYLCKGVIQIQKSSRNKRACQKRKAVLESSLKVVPVSSL